MRKNFHIKLGKTEAETLRINNWGVGDILEGDEGFGPDRILITGVGIDNFLCVWDYNCKGSFAGRESANTTLVCRPWKKVGNIIDARPLEAR